MLTQGEFFLALAQLGKRYQVDPTGVQKILIGKHAAEFGIDVDFDDKSPHEEWDIIARPLEEFIKAVVNKMDVLFVSAYACLAWEAYKRYQAAKEARLARARYKEEHLRLVGST